jgi:hypothetical protein
MGAAGASDFGEISDCGGMKKLRESHSSRTGEETSLRTPHRRRTLVPRVGNQPPAFSSIRARIRLLAVGPLLRDLKPLLKPIDGVDPLLRLWLGDAILIAEDPACLDT